jgi:hypothetical protein
MTSVWKSERVQGTGSATRIERRIVPIDWPQGGEDDPGGGWRRVGEWTRSAGRGSDRRILVAWIDVLDDARDTGQSRDAIGGIAAALVACRGPPLCRAGIPARTWPRWLARTRAVFGADILKQLRRRVAVSILPPHAAHDAVWTATGAIRSTPRRRDDAQNGQPEDRGEAACR